jgi:hypothetical protein
MGRRARARGVFRPWAALVALVVAAGCLSPSGPSAGPSASSSGSEAQDPMVVRVGFGEPGAHLEAELRPAVIVPGQSVTTQASLVNDGDGPFEFQDCQEAADADQDDRGQTWGYEWAGAGQRVYQGLYLDGLCPPEAEGARTSLAAGGRETFVRTWGATASMPPGPMWVNLTFHGLHASLPFTLSFGEGGGEPTIEVHANRTALRAGEQVLVEATVRNPTERFFRYWVRDCGVAVGLGVATSQGTAAPPRPMCSGPAYPTNLAPGETVRGALLWDGRWYDRDGHGTPDPGNHTVSASFAYTDGEGRSGALGATLVLAVE